jgi:hypothetical protein
MVLGGCSSKGEPPTQQPTPPPVDAAPADTITEIGGNDPDRFVDPDPTHRVPAAKKPRVRPARPIDIMLKSSPSGATAFVDGVAIGPTPTYWYGDSDGKEHEFAFSLRGHGVGRYRFVPIQSGTVHARLAPMTEDTPIDPTKAPGGGTPRRPLDTPKPPDTVLTPNPNAGNGTNGSGNPNNSNPGNGANPSNGTNAPGGGSGTNPPAGSGSGRNAGSGSAGTQLGGFPGGSKIGPQP